MIQVVKPRIGERIYDGAVGSAVSGVERGALQARRAELQHLVEEQVAELRPYRPVTGSS